jgi:hypothetical protein
LKGKEIGLVRKGKDNSGEDHPPRTFSVEDANFALSLHHQGLTQDEEKLYKFDEWNHFQESLLLNYCLPVFWVSPKVSP